MNSYSTRLSKLPTSLWQRLAQIDEVKGQWHHGAGLSPQVLGRLKRSVLITSTGASTRIEGAHLSDEAVERLMRGPRLQQFADRDAQEVRGYYEVLQLVFDSFASIDLTENQIKQLHALLLRYATKDQRHRGQYKTLANKVEMTDVDGHAVPLFDTMPPYLTAKQMAELVAWTNQELAAATHHPLCVIGTFVVEFLKIHPFLDGNGRLSRVLTNMLLLRAGYNYPPYVSHEHLIEANKTDYYLALRRAQTTFGTDHETVTPWLEFFITICLTQARQAAALLSNTAITQLLSPNQLLVWNYLGTVDEAPPRTIAKATTVPQPTVAQALDKLLALDKVERLGLGRATRYRRCGDEQRPAQQSDGGDHEETAA
jgi:Fic family protein